MKLVQLKPPNNFRWRQVNCAKRSWRPQNIESPVKVTLMIENNIFDNAPKKIKVIVKNYLRVAEY